MTDTKINLADILGAGGTYCRGYVTVATDCGEKEMVEGVNVICGEFEAEIVNGEIIRIWDTKHGETQMNSAELLLDAAVEARGWGY